LGFFNTLLMVFAVVALFVGSFIIYNTFSIIVAQRKRENAVLRHRRQRTTGDVGAAARSSHHGIVGSLVGFGAGFVMAVLRSARRQWASICRRAASCCCRARSSCPSPWALITVLPAVLPARRGSKVPPIAALRDEAVEQTGFTSASAVGGIARCDRRHADRRRSDRVARRTRPPGVALLFIALFVLRTADRPTGVASAGCPCSAVAPASENWLVRTRCGTRSVRLRRRRTDGGRRPVWRSRLRLVDKASIRSVFGKQFVGDFVVSTQTFGFGGLPCQPRR
jgi:hypothetical protein